MNDKVVYAHYKESDGTIFYIGYGDRNRPHDEIRRHKDWKEIVKESGYRAEILYENLSVERAQELEKQEIAFYGRADKGLGPLINKTDGGDGFDGVLVSGKKNGRYNHKIYHLYDLIRENITSVVKGRYLRHDGWICLNPDKKFKGTKLDVNIYEFEHNDGSIEKCNKKFLVDKYNLTSSKITQVIQGKRKSHKGWKIKRST